MIVILAFLLGAVYGWFRAVKLGGKLPDRVQFALGFGLAFTVVGLIVAVIISRL